MTYMNKIEPKIEQLCVYMVMTQAYYSEYFFLKKSERKETYQSL